MPMRLLCEENYQTKPFLPLSLTKLNWLRLRRRTRSSGSSHDNWAALPGVSSQFTLDRFRDPGSESLHLRKLRAFHHHPGQRLGA